MCRHILLVFYKVFCLYKNRSICLFLSLLPPIIMYIVTDQQQKHFKCHNSTSLVELTNNNTVYFYAPQNDFTNKIIQIAAGILNTSWSFQRIKPYPDHDSLLHQINGRYADDENTRATLILFDNTTGNSTPQEFIYTIRSTLDDETLFHIQQQTVSFIPEEENFYWKSDFIRIQYALNFAYMQVLQKPLMRRTDSLDKKKPTVVPTHGTMKSHDIKVNIKPNCIIKEVKKKNIVLLYLFIIGTEILSMSVMVHDMVRERQEGLKGLLNVNNMSSILYWLGWYVAAIFPNALLIIFMSFTFDLLIWRTDLTLVIFILATCIHSCLLMGITFGIFFNGLLTYILLALGVLFYFLHVMPHENFLMILWYLVPSWTVGKLIEIILKRDETINLESLKWGTLTKLDEKNVESIWFALCMYVCVDTVIYLILIWFFDQVLSEPKRFAHPWYFLYQYWRGTKVRPTTQVEITASSNENIQKHTPKYDVSIHVQNLTKKYENCTAVNDVTMQIYSNQITALLGSCRSGKTTFLSMIVGHLSVTSGRIMVHGFDMAKKRGKVQQRIGFCPQHTILIPYMTIEEHLTYFGILKGMQHTEANTNAQTLISQFGLSVKGSPLPKNLSAGMRRRLQVLLAVCSPKTDLVILDEPSISVDFESKMEIWNIIRSYREKRMILFTTHSMNEANELADHIAIINNGTLQCYGTPGFLNKIYGVGYDLRVVFSDTPRTDSIIAITNIVVQTIPNSEIKIAIGKLLLYQIPSHDSILLSNLFSILEEKREFFNIVNLGLNVRSIDYVFLKVKLEDEGISYRGPIYTTTEGFNRYCIQITGLCYNFFAYFRHRLLDIFLCILIIVLATIFFWHKLGMQAPKETSFHITFGMTTYPNATFHYSVENSTENLGIIYKTLIPNSFRVKSNVIEEYKTLMKKNYVNYSLEAMFGTDFRYDKITGYFSMFWRHSAAENLNAICNTLLKSQFVNNSIITTNKPIQRPNNAWNKFYFGYSAMLYWAVLQLPFLIFIHDQKKIKHLQLMAGVGSITYWLFNIVIEFVICAILTSVWTVLILQMDISKFYNNIEDLGAILCTLFVFIIMMYILACCCSIFFDHWYVTFVLLFCIDLVPSFSRNFAALTKIIDKIVWFLPLPGFKKLIDLLDESIYKFKHCQKTAREYFHIVCDPDVRLSNGFDRYCCSMKCEKGCQRLYIQRGEFFEYWKIYCITAAVYFGILVILEWKMIPKLLWCFLARQEMQSSSSDVNYERHRVKDNWKKDPIAINSDLLLVKELRKSYFSFNKMLCTEGLKGISFGVGRNECFGLLGMDGSGKSTLIKMLTDEIPSSSGDASIDGWRLSFQTPCFLSRIGYCPRKNALSASMTVFQHLKMFALTKGVPRNLVKDAANFWIGVLGLQEFRGRTTKNLSAVEQRKLCLGIALIGNPEIIVCDEPTTNLDPITRYRIWSILEAAQSFGQSILLTTQDRDECKALCQRVAILIDGVIKCVGTVDYLKLHYTHGFTISIHLNATTSPEIIASISSQMSDKFKSKLLERTTEFIRFTVSDNSVRLSFLFSQMEIVKTTFYEHILEFIITDTSLEKICATMLENTGQR